MLMPFTVYEALVESAMWGFQNIGSLTLKFLRVARGSLCHNFSCIEAQAHCHLVTPVGQRTAVVQLINYMLKLDVYIHQVQLMKRYIDS